MFSLSDIQQTRVYQEAREEGREEEKISTVRRFSALGLSAEQIAVGTGLSSCRSPRHFRVTREAVGRTRAGVYRQG